jgi:hypothetical protein
MKFPCVFVLYPKLAHRLHFSPFYLSPLLMVISTGLKILYSLAGINLLFFLNQMLAKCNYKASHFLFRIKIELFIIKLNADILGTSF